MVRDARSACNEVKPGSVPPSTTSWLSLVRCIARNFESHELMKLTLNGLAAASSARRDGAAASSAAASSAAAATARAATPVGGAVTRSPPSSPRHAPRPAARSTTPRRPPRRRRLLRHREAPAGGGAGARRGRQRRGGDPGRRGGDPGHHRHHLDGAPASGHSDADGAAASAAAVGEDCGTCSNCLDKLRLAAGHRASAAPARAGKILPFGAAGPARRPWRRLSSPLRRLKEEIARSHSRPPPSCTACTGRCGGARARRRRRRRPRAAVGLVRAIDSSTAMVLLQYVGGLTQWNGPPRCRRRRPPRAHCLAGFRLRPAERRRVLRRLGDRRHLVGASCTRTRRRVLAAAVARERRWRSHV